MPTFHVAARSAQPPAPPARHLARSLRRLLVVLGYAHGISIVAGLFVLILVLSHTQLTFVLLPVGASVAVIALTSRYRLTSPRAVLITLAVALIYFVGITAFELITHAGVSSKVILVSTTLAVAVIFEPLHSLLQSYLERRFPGGGDATGMAIATFTASLREEIDLEQVRDRFLAIVQRLLRPQYAALWLRTPVRNATSGPVGAHSVRGASDAAERAQGLATPPEPALATPLAEMKALEWTRQPVTTLDVCVDERDPLIVYATRHPGAVELDELHADSALLRNLREQAVEVMVPLVSQGELLGMLLLGPRARLGTRAWWASVWFIVLPFTYLLVMSRRFYTGEDLGVLNTLAAQVAPALRVVRLVRTQQEQVRARERIEQELRTAQEIQRTFLPKEVPELPGWQLVPYYQPAREVGGDFYDAFTLADGRVGLIIGDVTGKGIPAALMMTATRTMLRTAAQEQAAPGAVLARVNDLLCADITPGMFVTCFYALLDPANGQLCFANAGHEAPFRRQAGAGGVSELWASGMPLGLMPGTRYDEYAATLQAGESLLLYSDGLVEAHNASREMFGLPRLRATLAQPAAAGDGEGESAACDDALIGTLLAALAAFTGDGWEQEDDVTLLALHRALAPSAGVPD